MIRLLGFLLKLGIVIALAVWIADRSGTVTIEWKDKIIETSTLLLALAVGAVALLSYYISKFFSFVRTAPAMIRLRQRLYQQRKGERLLSSAVYALADEKKSRAVFFLRRAEKLLGKSQVVEMVRSQAEDVSAVPDHGDYGSPFAWKEAIERHLRAGRLIDAKYLAENFAARHERLALPKRMLFEVYIREQNWERAQRMLDELREAGSLPRSELRLARAAILAERGRLALEQGRAAEAFEYARQADRLRPHWVPSLLLAARALAQQDKPREAASLVEKSWPLVPHAQLGMVYLSLKTGKSEVKKAQAAENLARRSGYHPAARLIVAESLLRAGILAQARFTATELAKEHPSREVYNLLARIEQADRHFATAQDWQNKAAECGMGEAWICTHCRQPHKNWQALCSSCREFNTLSWETQPALIAAQ